MEEIWKILINNYCEISNYGRVRTLKRIIRYNNINREIPEKYLSLKPHKNTGYISIKLSYNGINISKAVHILVAELFIDNPLNKPFVNHIDSNRSNNHFLNLEWVTTLENIQHAYKNNRMSIGSNHPISKLTEENVKEIVYLLKMKISRKEIANYFKVQVGIITQIALNNTWKHIPR